MSEEPQTQQVEVSFVGTPPTKEIERAAGVAAVEVDGSIVRCTVCGSFQPFLEALHGYEVLNLTSTPKHRSNPEGVA